MRQAHPEFSVQDLGNFDKYYEAAYKVDTLWRSCTIGSGGNPVLCLQSAVCL